MRDTIFISHATPDDNEFVRWLGTRLVGHGYKVWADLFQLKGGTPFWNSIEEALRTRATKVIFVASRKSVDPGRSGVRNELSVADAVKKSLKDDSFIIPLRIDDVPFSDLPIQIHQLNTIDFSRGWGGKLLELLDSLEHSKTPRDLTSLDQQMAQWRATAARTGTIVESQPEPLLTNLLPIRSLPDAICFYEFEGDNTSIRAVLDKSGIPYSLFLRLILSFAEEQSFRSQLPSGFEVRLARRVAISDFLKGPGKDETGPVKSEARRVVTYLIRRHIEFHLVQRGLQVLETSGAPAFFFPVNLIEDSKVFYTAASGKRTWKRVTGRSERNRIYWHLAMKVNVDLGPPSFVRFKPYLCFSENGTSAISDVKITSAIRRRFCKNWWNPQWRQLQQAFIAFLTNEADDLCIPLSTGEKLILAGSLMQVTGCRRMPEDLQVMEEPEEPPEVDDEDDDFEDFADEDSDEDEA